MGRLLSKLIVAVVLELRGLFRYNGVYYYKTYNLVKFVNNNKKDWGRSHMKMDKKITISIISLAIVIALFALIWNLVSKKNESNDINSGENLNIDESQNIMNISAFEPVTDDCITEAEILNAIEEASNNLSDDNTRYLIQSVNGYIFVYYLNDENEKYLYKRTTIAVDYLSQEDMDDLEVGIEVVGIEKLNKMLEDFE